MKSTLDRNYVVSGGVVNQPAATAALAVVLFVISNYAGQIGTKSFIPRKIRVRNNAGGNLWLNLGTGVGGAFVARIPAIRVINNFDDVWQELNLPRVEFFASMTGWVDALVAGGSLDIQVEAEENG
jgi:hypothetical protein